MHRKHHEHHQFTVAMLLSFWMVGFGLQRLYILHTKKGVVVRPIENAAGLGLNLKRSV
jgi:TM2 domain-containing membrane protein YozV